jgi:hypothetical protein
MVPEKEGEGGSLMRPITLRVLVPKHADLLAGLFLILTLGLLVYYDDAESLEDLLGEGSNAWFGFVLPTTDPQELCKGRICI